MTSTIFTRRHLLGIEELTAAEIEDLLGHAAQFTDPKARTPRHTGRSIVNLFYESSTRTRTSFELAAKRLDAEVINIDIATSSVKKGETLVDTARTLGAMDVDAIIIRHNESGAAQKVADQVKCSVVNAGDGTHEHPTQALLDAFTIRQRRGKIAGLNIAICGDIRHSRVARSNIFLLSKLGAHLRIIGPGNLLPPETEKMGAKRFTTMAEGLEGADVVMMLRIQLERMDIETTPDLVRYQNTFRLDREKLAFAKPDALVMHPGPLNRMVEITDEVADDPKHSVILDQVRNGIAMRMAVLDRLLAT
ncbi:MAG: aspartate carbamoyltransferase catalytic subunit [Alphaproteobacteria bacterium]